MTKALRLFDRLLLAFAFTTLLVMTFPWFWRIVGLVLIVTLVWTLM